MYHRYQLKAQIWNTTGGKQPILTRRMGYTRIGHRTGRRVFFVRIETDDVTTVLSQR